eukprot:6462382-Amphidinium_carterae.5
MSSQRHLKREQLLQCFDHRVPTMLRVRVHGALQAGCMHRGHTPDNEALVRMSRREERRELL